MVNNANPAPLTLRGDGGEIQVHINEGLWSDCWFEAGERIYLGSEDTGHLFRDLLNGVVEDKGVDAGEINGLKVKWVLTLQIACGRLYTGFEKGKRVLFWLNLQGHVIGTIRLRSSDLNGWRVALESRLKQVSGNVH